MEELDLTIELLSGIFLDIGVGKVASILKEYAERQKGDKPMSLSELNLNLKEYIAKYLVQDINNGSRMVRIGQLYLPLNAIKTWKTEDKYSYLESRMKYDLIINAKDQNPSVFDNQVMSYIDKEERRKDIEKLLEMKLSNPQL